MTIKLDRNTKFLHGTDTPKAAVIAAKNVMHDFELIFGGVSEMKSGDAAETAVISERLRIS